jgi:ATP-dependent HslUV protease ATP-binding subunit HslU
MERLLEDILFEAPDINDKRQIINKKYVIEKLSDVVEDEDLTRYIL